jgi:hypothetical protein
MKLFDLEKDMGLKNLSGKQHAAKYLLSRIYFE